jgi:hypothetical protein
MSSQSILHTKRQITRAQATIAEVLAAPEGQWVPLRSLAADFVDHADAFKKADEEVRRIQAQSAKEVDEAVKSLAPLAQAYDAARIVVSAKVGSTYPPASALNTPDDLITSSDELRDELELHEAEPWAGPLCAVFSATLDSAVKEQSEASDALKLLQKAQQQRAMAAGGLRPVFVNFRRLVRVEFGRSSREYHELLDRRSSGSSTTASNPSQASPNDTAKPAVDGDEVASAETKPVVDANEATSAEAKPAVDDEKVDPTAQADGDKVDPAAQ